jgi:hypothetical protein
VPFTAGQRITAQELNDALPLPPAVKSADETVSASTTPQNDDHLFVTVSANSVYVIELEGMHTSSAAGDIKVIFSVPSGTTGVLFGLDATLPFAGTSLTGSLVFGGTGAAAYFRVAGRAVTSSTAGTIRVTFAQQVASGSSSLLTGTFLRLTKVS